MRTWPSQTQPLAGGHRGLNWIVESEPDLQLFVESLFFNPVASIYFSAVWALVSAGHDINIPW